MTIADWTDQPLGELCRFQAGSAFPRHEQGADADEIPFIKVSDMNRRENSVRIVVANNWVSADAAKRMRLRLAPPGSVVFAKIGEALKAERLRVLTRPTAIDNNMMAAIGKASVDARFLRYLLEFVHLADWAEGSALPYLRQSDLEQMPVAVPGLAEQRSIAATLGALDDKLESNRRAIDLAEALGDALFSAAAADTVALRDVAVLTMGSSPPGSSYNEVGIGLPFYQGARDFGRRFPGLRVWTTAPVRLAEVNDTLVSVRAPVGDLNRASGACCIGRGVASVRSATPSTIYYALRAANDLWEPFQQEGTVFGAINRADLAAARLPWPTITTLRELEAALAAIDGRIAALSREIDRLVALRDALLPELLSGRIRADTDADTSDVTYELEHA